MELLMLLMLFFVLVGIALIFFRLNSFTKEQLNFDHIVEGQNLFTINNNNYEDFELLDELEDLDLDFELDKNFKK